MKLLKYILAIFIFSACTKTETTSVLTPTCDQDNTISIDRIACTEKLTYQNSVSITTSSFKRYITANHIPEHMVGKFPNAFNPNAIQPQNEVLTVTRLPLRNQFKTDLQGNSGPMYAFGIALNGIVFDPVAAEPWGKGTLYENWIWNLEAMFNNLGLDCNMAHVQPNGEYHYHGVPTLYISTFNPVGNAMVQIGWAADGFPVYYKYGFQDAVNANSAIVGLRSSYLLKTGTRGGDGVTFPCGEYNGKYVNDFIYESSYGDLDECNGRYGVTPEFPTGTYYYVVTDEFPGIPRCLFGTPDQTFKVGP